MGMSITLAGAPENGDVVIFHTEDRPARTFEVLIKDIDRVAAAATMRQIQERATSRVRRPSGTCPRGRATKRLSVWIRALQ